MMELLKPRDDVSPKLEMLSMLSGTLLIAPIQPLHLIQRMSQDIHIYSDCEYAIIYRCLANKMYNIIHNNEKQLNENMYLNRRRLRHICLLKTHLDVAAGWLN